MTINNPIIRGFHPDPSILSVGGDYYIATSTFEWFGGVEILHSRNLADWSFVSRPLSTREHLDLRGAPSSGGVWAPCLSWADGLFWLIFTDVKTWLDRPFKDCSNYLTTAADIRGPWSAPVYLNSSGFDPSLFHDDDGRKWLVNMEWDFRGRGKDAFTGILLQEYDAGRKELAGPVRRIYSGSSVGRTEGPHLYKRNGWYYLLSAEGGTSYEHQVTVARSRELAGSYETSPDSPLLTSSSAPDSPLQKAGHASWCFAPDGRCFMAFLVGRPLPGRQNCVLGRETSLAELVWVDDWPRLKSGGKAPPESFEVLPDLAPADPAPRPADRTYRFEDLSFLDDFMTLRTPWSGSAYSIADRPGYLRLYGKESFLSRHEQALIARRQTDFAFAAETEMEFAPTSFQHMAGLVYRYDERKQFYLRVTWDEKLGARRLGVVVVDLGEVALPAASDEKTLGDGPVRLKLAVDRDAAQFLWAPPGGDWEEVGPELEAWKLSDEYGGMGFTGAFVGLACQDLQLHRAPADFRYFRYTAL